MPPTNASSVGKAESHAGNNDLSTSSHPNVSRPTTPTRTNPFIAYKHTPAKPHSTQDHLYLNGSIDEMRSSILKDMDYVVIEVKRSSFFENILPRLKDEIDVKKIVKSLKREGYIVADKQPRGPIRRKWNEFRKEPRFQGRKEEEVFAALQTIFDEATKLASSSLEGLLPTFLFRMRPNHAPRSHRASTTRPDAHLIPRMVEEAFEEQENEVGQRLSRWWYDIFLTAEFKKGVSNKDRDDNGSKLLFNMQQTMTLDPCRRFTFGISAENTEMRIWFCSRSICCVTEAFDFTTEVELLTHAFLAFAFASKEQLGWDPTIHPFTRSNGERVYHIKVGDDTYETMEVLADSGADGLISRGPRIWKVMNVRSNELGVLKDYWIEDDRDLEHDIHRMILDDVEREYGVAFREKAGKHLLTPVAQWLVPVNGEDDHTTEVMMRGFNPPFDKGFNLKTHQPIVVDQKKATQPSAASDMIAQGSNKARLGPSLLSLARRRSIHCRKHYRIVFKEVGLCLYTVNHLSDVFTVLRDGAKVLKWIHGCGWLHRDISVQNLYFYNGRGLIGDLEYGKRKNSNMSHEVRSCSIDFLADEVIRNKFEYLPANLAIEAATKRWPSKRKGPKGGNGPLQFFPHDLHDLESIWWVAIWELFFNRGSLNKEKRRQEDKEEGEDKLKEKRGEVEGEEGDEEDEDEGDEGEEEDDGQREGSIRTLFPRTERTEARHEFIGGLKGFLKHVHWMPTMFLRTAKILEGFRGYLISKYEEFEASLPNAAWHLLEGTQDRLVDCLEQCRKKSFGIELTPYKSTGLRNLELSAAEEARVQKQPGEAVGGFSTEMKSAEDLFSEMDLNNGGKSDHDGEDDDQSDGEDDEAASDNDGHNDSFREAPISFRMERYDLNHDYNSDDED